MRCVIELARAVRTGPGTEVAAHALVLIDEHDAVGPLVGSAGRTDRHAVRVRAMHARHRKVDRLVVGILAHLEMTHAVEPYAGRFGSEGIVVGERAAYLRRCVPLLARRGAGMAADAGIEIDGEAESHRFTRDSARCAVDGRAGPATASSRRTPARCRSRPARTSPL